MHTSLLLAHFHLDSIITPRDWKYRLPPPPQATSVAVTAQPMASLLPLAHLIILYGLSAIPSLGSSLKLEHYPQIFLSFASPFSGSPNLLNYTYKCTLNITSSPFPLPLSAVWPSGGLTLLLLHASTSPSHTGPCLGRVNTLRLRP